MVVSSCWQVEIDDRAKAIDYRQPHAGTSMLVNRDAINTPRTRQRTQVRAAARNHAAPLLNSANDR